MSLKPNNIKRLLLPQQLHTKQISISMCNLQLLIPHFKGHHNNSMQQHLLSLINKNLWQNHLDIPQTRYQLMPPSFKILDKQSNSSSNTHRASRVIQSTEVLIISRINSNSPNTDRILIIHPSIDVSRCMCFMLNLQ